MRLAYRMAPAAESGLRFRSPPSLVPQYNVLASSLPGKGEAAMNTFLILFVVVFVLAIVAVCAIVAMRMLHTFDAAPGPRFRHRRLHRSTR